ncbi:lipase family protein [Pseudomonadota bacterium]
MIRGKNITRVHCVGHSMGGALSNLIADWIIQEKIAPEAEIYTFGSPRVGLRRFAENLRTTVGENRIHRAYHKTDIVPMVPVWPFFHGPEPGKVCYIESPGSFPGAKYHDKELYLKSVKGHKTWDTLHGHPPPTHMDQQIEGWLDSDSPLSLTTSSLSLINSSILYVIKKIALAGLQFAIGALVNVIDLLAAFLTKAASLSKEITGLIGKLMRRILQCVGITIKETTNITYQFVRWVFEKMTSALYKSVQMAIRLTHGG